MQTGKQDKAFDNNHKTKLNWKKRETSYTEGLFKVLWFFSTIAHTHKKSSSRKETIPTTHKETAFFSSRSHCTQCSAWVSQFFLFYSNHCQSFMKPPQFIFLFHFFAMQTFLKRILQLERETFKAFTKKMLQPVVGIYNFVLFGLFNWIWWTWMFYACLEDYDAANVVFAHNHLIHFIPFHSSVFFYFAHKW